MEAQAKERPAGAEEKVWGWAETIHEQRYQRDDGTWAVRCRVVRVFIKAGGYSSIHCHPQSTNLFTVIEGKLTLTRHYREPPYEQEVSWLQQPCDHPAVFVPGVFHKFEALTDVLGLEIYSAKYQGDASVLDIDRVTTNGVKIGSTGDLNLVANTKPLRDDMARAAQLARAIK